MYISYFKRQISMSKKVAKWLKWIQLIGHDCGNLILSKDMFLDLRGLIAKNPKMQEPDYFHDYMHDTYLAHVLMMLRKHVKTDSQSISLVSLSQDILDNSNEITTPFDSQSIQMKLDQFKICAKTFE